MNCTIIICGEAELATVCAQLAREGIAFEAANFGEPGTYVITITGF